MTDEQAKIIELSKLKAARERRGSQPTPPRVIKVLKPDGHWYINGIRQERQQRDGQ